MGPNEYWDSIYRAKGEQGLSWFEHLPAVSLEMLEAAGVTTETCVIDVGGGESRLIDALVAKGLDCLAVLDVSGTALQHARSRVGSNQPVVWIEADVTGEWSSEPMDIWHDRAVFHFLVTPDQRAQYRDHLRTTLKRDGSAIIATFALDGPTTCSGLPVERYSPEMLATVLGDEFELIESRPYTHLTPWLATQSFQYSRFRRH